MYEVEFKVRADHDAVRERLVELDAVHRGAVTQTDTYYSAPHRDFAETDEALRIRAIEPTAGEAETRLTYKGPLVDETSKTREEVETEIPDADAVEDILCNLGFERAASVRKERDRYAYDGHHVVLDEVEGLGQFVEVEAAAGDDDLDAVRDSTRDVLEQLGLDPEDQLRTSYLAMVLGDA